MESSKVAQGWASYENAAVQWLFDQKTGIEHEAVMLQGQPKLD